MSFMTKCSINRFIKTLNLFNTMPRQLCNTEKFFQELGLESLQNRRKLRTLCLFYLFYHTLPYLHNLNPKNFQTSYSLGTTNDISLFRVKHGFFKSFSFHSRIIEQNNLDYHLCNAPSINVFKQNILKFICLGPDKVYNVHNPTGLKLLTRLRLGSSHLRAHKFSHNFSDCLDELCICETNIESTNRFLLQCPLYLSERQTLIEKIRDVEISILDQNESYLLYSTLWQR